MPGVLHRGKNYFYLVDINEITIVDSNRLVISWFSLRLVAGVYLQVSSSTSLNVVIRPRVKKL